MDLPIQTLSQPFDNVKQRKGNFGQMLDYVEAASVIQRLNEVLQGEWSFEILDYRINQDEVIVRGQLTVANIVKQQFGSSKVTRHKDTGEREDEVEVEVGHVSDGYQDFKQLT